MLHYTKKQSRWHVSITYLAPHCFSLFLSYDMSFPFADNLLPHCFFSFFSLMKCPFFLSLVMPCTCSWWIRPFKLWIPLHFHFILIYLANMKCMYADLNAELTFADKYYNHLQVNLSFLNVCFQHHCTNNSYAWHVAHRIFDLSSCFCIIHMNNCIVI